MRVALLVLLGLHLAHSLFRNGRVSPGKPRTIRFDLFVIQFPLFGVAAAIAYMEGALGRELLNPLYISAGLVLGHVVFVLSLLTIHQSVSDAREVLLGFGAIWEFMVESPLILSRYVGVAVTEEVIYRVAAQGALIALLGNSWAVSPSLRWYSRWFTPIFSATR